MGGEGLRQHSKPKVGSITSLQYVCNINNNEYHALQLSRSKPATMCVARYAEVIGKSTQAKDVPTGRRYDLSKDVQLKPRQSLVLEVDGR